MNANSEKTEDTIISLSAPTAKEVYIAGSFNDWDSQVTPMKQAKDGIWKASLRLPPGRHEYKFVIDGNWFCAPECEGDQECPQCIPNNFGSMNHIIDI